MRRKPGFLAEVGKRRAARGTAVTPTPESGFVFDAMPSRHDTPMLPPSPPLARDARASLMVLTGVHAGRLVSVGDAVVTIGRDPEVELVVDEVGVSRHHARVGRTPEGGFYVEDLGSTNGTFRGTERVGLAQLGTGDMLQIGTHVRVRFAVVDAIEESLCRRLYESSMHDPLTHMFNRRYLLDRLADALDEARRSRGDLAVLSVDIDSLKHVNDEFGHLAGDRALCAIAARIARSVRAEDVLARYGGDEFVVLALDSDGVDARQLAERIRRAAGGLRMRARGRDVRITASIGVACLVDVLPCVDPGAALLALADTRMYAAKASGGNCIGTGTVSAVQRAPGSSR
jgi:diguanylate cyclase (GGDEF)-like protein